MCWIVCAGVVSTLAGSSSATWADGLGIAARFNGPRGLSVDFNGTVYVGDYFNNRIRKVSSSGVCLDSLRIYGMSFMEMIVGGCCGMCDVFEC